MLIPDLGAHRERSTNVLITLRVLKLKRGKPRTSPARLINLPKIPRYSRRLKQIISIARPLVAGRIWTKSARQLFPPFFGFCIAMLGNALRRRALRLAAVVD